jgi:hypothetical protein
LQEAGRRDAADAVHPNLEEEPMTRLTRKALTVMALAAAALTVVVGTATATKTVKVPSKVTIKSKSLKFSGKVSTAAIYEPCQQHRKVTLFKVVSGGPDQALGHTTTNNKGAWTITPQGSAGISLASFYAKVKQVSEGTAGTIYVCQAGRSKTIKPTP